MTPINGLLRVKPANVPEVGNVVSLSASTVTGKSGKPYTKFKRDTAEYGGVDCTIVSVKPLGEPDQHGNVMLVLDVEGPLSVAAEGASAGPVAAPNASNGRSGDDDRTEQINRSVAYKGAVEICAARIQQGELKPEDAASAIATLTTALLPVVTGESSPPTPPAQSGSPVKTDDDIPF